MPVAVGPTSTSAGHAARARAGGAGPRRGRAAGTRTARGGIVIDRRRLQPGAHHPGRHARGPRCCPGATWATASRPRSSACSTTASATSSCWHRAAARAGDRRPGPREPRLPRARRRPADGGHRSTSRTWTPATRPPSSPPWPHRGRPPGRARPGRARGGAGQQRPHATTPSSTPAPPWASWPPPSRAAGGPTYQFRGIDPVDDQDGGEPGGNIRVVLMFRSDRGLAFVDRPGGTATTRQPGALHRRAFPACSYSPGRLDPAQSRLPQQPQAAGRRVDLQRPTLFVVANHFNSKGGDQPLFGRFQPPASSARKRSACSRPPWSPTSSSELLADRPRRPPSWCWATSTTSHFSPPLARLNRPACTALVDTLPPAERYTYVFEGNSQALDHILVSPSRWPQCRLRHRPRQRRVRRPGQRPRPHRRPLRPVAWPVHLRFGRAHTMGKGLRRGDQRRPCQTNTDF